jgi:hypothetical protein
VEANSTGGQGSCRAVAPSDDDDKILLEFVAVLGMSVFYVQKKVQKIFPSLIHHCAHFIYKNPIFIKIAPTANGVF